MIAQPWKTGKVTASRASTETFLLLLPERPAEEGRRVGVALLDTGLHLPATRLHQGQEFVN